MNAVVLSRIVAFAWAGAAIAVALKQGEVVPVWIVGVVARAGGETEVSIRLVSGLCVAVAGLLLALGPRARVPALVACGVLAFSGIADGSARLAVDASLLPAIVQFVVGLGLGIPLLKAEASTTRLRHPGLAGTLAVLAMIAGAGVAANLDVAPDTVVARGRGEDGRFIVHDITPTDWIDQPLEATGILDHLPAIGSLVQDQPSLIAFYRPNCGPCHDMFDGWLADSMSARLIAVRVPPADGVELTESDLPEDVACDDCVRLAFPEGPVWLLQTPVLVEVVDGMVTCVSTDDYARCVDHAIAAADAYFAAEDAAAAEATP